MTPEKNLAAREARHGEKMIEVKIRFWTNDIASEPGKIKPKHAWSAGVVRIEGNKSHGIVPFHTLLDVGSVIEKVLIEQCIVLHPGQKMAKYVRDAD
jgi:hypothetical protein